MQKLYTKGIAQKDATGKIVVVVSDESVDRAGDSIPVASWDLKNFLTAPRMFVDHDYRVEKLTGVWEDAKVVGKELVMSPLFHDLTELARVNKELVDQGFLNTTSVGYIPHKMKDGSVVNELLEVSWVGVPCNPNARVQGRSINNLGEIVKQLEDAEAIALKEFCKDKGIEEIEAKAPAAGDACTMDDGSDGVMMDDGNGGLSCQLKPAEESKKGMIDDVNAANQELREAKWPMLCAVWAAFDAFWCAWMSDATTMEQFGPMLADLSTTLLALQSGTVPIDETANDEDSLFLSIQGATQKMMSFRGLQQKAGRELSKENRDIIASAIASIEAGTSALKDLHAATDTSVVENADTGKGTGGEDKSVERSNPTTPQAKKEMQEWLFKRRVLQAVNTITAEACAEMRKKLSN